MLNIENSHSIVTRTRNNSKMEPFEHIKNCFKNKKDFEIFLTHNAIQWNGDYQLTYLI